MEKCSDKSYVLAVCLSATLGVLGIHHFYLGRIIEGICDLGLSVIAFFFFLRGQLVLGVLALFADWLHSFIVTILLLTGTFRDGKGYRVCYPGQKLK